MRRITILALFSILTSQTGSVFAQGSFSAGATPRSLTFTPIDPTRAMSRPSILTAVNPFGRFNPANLMRGVRINLLQWPPITASSKFPDDVRELKSSFPTEIFPFPTDSKLLDSSSLPTMKIQSQFLR